MSHFPNDGKTSYLQGYLTLQNLCYVLPVIENLSTQIKLVSGRRFLQCLDFFQAITLKTEVRNLVFVLLSFISLQTTTHTKQHICVHTHSLALSTVPFAQTLVHPFFFSHLTTFNRVFSVIMKHKHTCISAVYPL